MRLFITFASPSHMYYAQQLCESALSKGGFDHAKIYTIHDIDSCFVKRNNHILNNRKGAGYWLWKPYIIMKAMNENCNNGDVLVYCDSMYKFSEDVSDFVDQHINKSNIQVAISTNKPNEPTYLESNWTKGDNYLIMNCSFSPTSKQAWAGFLCFKKSTSSVEFVGSWLGYSQDERLITDSVSLYKPNHENFKENRHDQSVLSLLSNRYGLELYDFPKRYLENLRVPY